MNGYKLLTEAARLIGLEQTDDNLKITGLPMVNSVLTELGLCELASLSEAVEVSSAVMSALRFGVASLIAAAQGDTETFSVMEQKYRAAYSKRKSRIERVKDVLPKGDF